MLFCGKEGMKDAGPMIRYQNVSGGEMGVEVKERSLGEKRFERERTKDRNKTHTEINHRDGKKESTTHQLFSSSHI